MNYLGVSFDYKNKPLLDESFLPFGVWAEAFLQGAERPFRVALEREKGHVSVFSSFLRGEEYSDANLCYLERYVKFLLWSVGGWKVTICGCTETAEKLINELELLHRWNFPDKNGRLSVEEKQLNKKLEAVAEEKNLDIFFR